MVSALSGKQGNAAVSRFQVWGLENGRDIMRPIYLVAIAAALVVALSVVMIWGPSLTA